MSLINIFRHKSKISLFTTPSHTQKLFICSKLRQFYKYDISENDAYNPQKALKLSQKKASKIYKTKSTYFLINGSTSGIIASILACVKKDENVLIWNKSHPSHKNAIVLAGANALFYEVADDKEWGIPIQTNPEEIESKLRKQKVKAVIITSPTYEGIVSNIASIKEICKKYGAYLIVDEAHGALYPFCKNLPTSAIYSGADFVVQSLHKTAGGLNPTALLHCNIESIDLESALNLISTTSPSYPLLLSIEKNINFLSSKRGEKKILKLIENITDFKTKIKYFKFYTKNDPTKILIKTEKLSGHELSEFLFSNNIEDEKTNEKSTMLLCGVGTDLKKINKLQKVLHNYEIKLDIN